MRLAFCILALIAYTISFSLYFYNLTNVYYLPETKKLWYCYTTGLILVFYTIDGWRGYSTYLHDAISKCVMLSVIINFALIAAIHHGILFTNPVLRVCSFNLSCLVVWVMVFISSWKNGLFKK